MQNTNLNSAKKARKDEFYTLYEDIEKEVGAYAKHDPDVFRDKSVLLPCDDPERSNFTRYFLDHFGELGIRRLVSTCIDPQALSKSPLFDGIGHGRYLIRTSGGETSRGALEDTGDFRSREISELRDACDIIVTNPPFSLFREFVRWITDAQKKFLIIGNMNAIAYKEIFPLIKENKIWLGTTWGLSFELPDDYLLRGQSYEKDGKKYAVLCNTCWFTSLTHGKRHEPLKLHTMEWNRKHSKHKEVKDRDYQHYDNYDAIEVPFTDAIPSDYEGVMGVPVSFLDKYCPEQFEILGMATGRDEFEARPTKRYINPMQVNPNGTLVNGSKANTGATIILPSIPNGIYYTADNASGPMQIMYARILIRHRHPEKYNSIDDYGEH